MSIPDVVTYQSQDRIAVITINRPDKRNALTKEVVERLNAAWLRFNGSDDRVAVIAATGDVAFTAGADLDDIPHDLWRAIPGIGVEVDKPVIAAVSGWVVGGGLLAIELEGGFDAGMAFMNRLALVTRAVSLGDAETLVQHPASMTHAAYSPEERRRHGISDGLVRLSIGLETLDDLREDILQALESI